MKRITFFMLLVFGLPSAVNAADGEFYVGLGHGSAIMEGPRTRETFRVKPDHSVTLSIYEPDQQLKGSLGVSEIHLGYNVNPFLSLELGYADYDKERLSYHRQQSFIYCAIGPCYNPFRPPDSVEIDTGVVSLGALLKYPVHTDFSIYGLLSYDRVKNSYRRMGSKDSEVSRQVGYGAGIRWAFSEDFAAKLQWKKTQTIHTDFAYNERLNLSDTRLILEMSL